MANGILSIIIGSMIALYQNHNAYKYSSSSTTEARDMDSHHSQEYRRKPYYLISRRNT